MKLDVWTNRSEELSSCLSWIVSSKSDDNSVLYRILALDYARNLQKGYKKVFMDQRDIDEEMAKSNGSGRFCYF